jgi:archaellum component FlaC
MAKLSKKEAEQQQQAKNRYWQNELDSLGIEPKQKKKELNDNKEELENLADIIKRAMFQDYKVAYSEKGDAYKEEAQSTVTVG